MEVDGNATFGGNVGIGFTTPAALLHLQQDAASTNTQIELSRIVRTTSGTAADAIGTYTGYQVENDSGGLTEAGRVGFLLRDANVSTSLGGEFTVSTWRDSASQEGIWEVLSAYADGSDKYICGNSSRENGPDCLSFTIGSGNTASFAFDGSKRLTWDDTDGTRFEVYTAQTTESLRFKTLGSQPIDFDTSNDGVNLTLTSGGNVGIGFTTPDRLTQIASDIDIVGSNASLLGAAGTQFDITGGSATGLQKKLVLGIDTTDNYGVIQAGNTSGTNYNLSLTPAGGNVGIGFTSPTSVIQVGGDITITGASSQPDLIIDHTGETSRKASIQFNDDGAATIQLGVDINGNAGTDLFVWYNSTTPLSLATSTGQLSLGITGSGAGLLLGGDAQLYRGAANNLYVASGDGLTLVDGTLTATGTGTHELGPIDFANGAVSGVTTLTTSGNVGIGFTAPTSAYGHGGTNVSAEVRNTATAANSQAQLFLATGAAANTGAIGTITWVVPNTSGGEKRASLIGSSLTADSSANITANLSFYTNNAGTLANTMTLSPSGALTVSGAINTDSTTDSSSGTTGSIQTDGGIGVAKSLYIGGKLGINTAPSAQSDIDARGALSQSGAEIDHILVLGTEQLTGGSAGLFSGVKVRLNTTVDTGTTLTRMANFYAENLAPTVNGTLSNYNMIYLESPSGTAGTNRVIDTASGGVLTTGGIWQDNASWAALKEDINYLDREKISSWVDWLREDFKPITYRYKLGEDGSGDQPYEYDHHGYLLDDFPEEIRQIVMSDINGGISGKDERGWMLAMMKELAQQVYELKQFSFSLDSDGNLTAPQIKVDKLLLTDDVYLSDITADSLLAYDFGSTDLVNNTSEMGYCNTPGVSSGSPGVECGQMSVDVLTSLKNLDKTLVDLRSKEATNSSDIAGIQLEVASSSARLSQLENEQRVTSNDLAAQLASASADLALTKSKVDDLASLNLTPPETLYATGSATLTTNTSSEATVSGMLTAYQAIIQDNFKVFGETTLAKTIIAGDLNVDGTLSIENGNEINVIGSASNDITPGVKNCSSTPGVEAICGILYLQKSSLASGLDIFNGKVFIDSSGNIQTSGKVVASSVKTNKLTISNQPVATSSASIGSATLPANNLKVIVQTTEASESAKVFITPTTLTDKVLSVTNIKNGQSFDAAITSPSPDEIKFNWWIIQTN